MKEVSYDKEILTSIPATIIGGIFLVTSFVLSKLAVNFPIAPTTGALVHNAGSVFVVLIATFLYDRKFA